MADLKRGEVSEANGKQTGFTVFSRTELDLQIRTYSEFLMRAAFFEGAKETANAFLYRVIALDMILGSGSESGVTKEVSSRAGVVTAYAFIGHAHSG